MSNPQSTRLMRIATEYPDFVKSLLISGLFDEKEIMRETEHYFLNPNTFQEKSRIKRIILQTKQAILN